MSEYGEDKDEQSKREALQPLNAAPVPKDKRTTAVAIRGPRSFTQGDEAKDSNAPITPYEGTKILASGHGAVAEEILQFAFENGIRVREDKDLAELLAHFDLDTLIPSEAFEAVAEILSYVYRANGEDDPFNVTDFDSMVKDAMTSEDKE